MIVISLALKWQLGLLYLDDIFVFSKTADEQFKHLCTVLRLLHSARFTLTVKACKILQREDWLFGILNALGRLELASDTMNVIQDLNDEDQ